MRRIIAFTIPPALAGGALIDFLTSRFTYRDRGGWADEIGAGRITVNGAPARPDLILRAGDQIAYAGAGIPEPEVATNVATVFSDRDLLVLDKPANLPVHPSGRYFNHTLWALLKERFGLAEPLFVNRLDRETSGLMVVALTPEAAKGCRTQFAGRAAEKRYTVQVEGDFPDSLQADGWLLDDPGGPVRKLRRFVREQPAEGAAEAASTAFRRTGRYGPVSEVEATLLTGRTHQIRATLKSLGFPVVGDKLYGVDPELFLRFCKGELNDADRTRLRLDRQALHASALRFRHPRNGRILAFESPLPPDMAALRQQLAAP